MDLFKDNIDNEILNLYNKSIINNQTTNYKFYLNEEIFRNIWYNPNINITPIQAKKIAKSFAEIQTLLREKEKTLYESHTYVSKHLNKRNSKVYKNDFYICLILFILLYILNNSKTT